MATPGFRLPAYEYPQNAVLDFRSVNDAIDTFSKQRQQGVENQRQNKLLAFREQQMGMDRERLKYELGGRDFQREQQDRQFGQQRDQQDRQFNQQQSLAGIQHGYSMAHQGAQFGQQRTMAGVQTDEHMRLAREKAILDRQELLEKARVLGLAPPEQSAQPQPTVNGWYNNDPALTEPPAQQPSFARTPQPQSMMPVDPYQRLTTPALSPEAAEADRRKRAGQALMLGDTKGAGKIINKEEDPKEYQTKDALFAERMARSEIMLRGAIGTPDQQKYNPGARINNFWPDTGMIANMTNSQTFRSYQGGAREWIAALLRKDTGAAVTQTEWDFYWPTFFPQPGDSPEVQKQKVDRRVMAAQGLRGASGPAFDRMYPGFDQEMRTQMQGQTLPPARGQAARPAKPSPQPGAVEDGYRFKGGDPSRPENWERGAQ
jgi:hypothetical protein